MFTKTIFVGTLAMLCVWRLSDPVGSDAVLLTSYERASGLFISDGWLSLLVQRATGITILDQVNSFLFGMMFAVMLSVLSWPIRKAASLCIASLAKLVQRKVAEPEEA